MKKVFAIALCAMFVVVAATAQKKSAPAQLRSMYMDDLFDDEGRLDTAKCRELIPNGIGHFSQFCMQQQVTLTGHAVSKPIRNFYFSGSVVSDKTNAKQ